MGIESITAKLAKSTSLQNYIDLIRCIHDHGMGVLGAFVFGVHDDEGPGVFEETVEWAKKAKLDYAQFSINTPEPGARDYEHAVRNNLITDWNWEHYDAEHPVRRFANITRSRYLSAQRLSGFTGSSLSACWGIWRLGSSTCEIAASFGGSAWRNGASSMSALPAAPPTATAGATMNVSGGIDRTDPLGAGAVWSERGGDAICPDEFRASCHQRTPDSEASPRIPASITPAILAVRCSDRVSRHGDPGKPRLRGLPGDLAYPGFV